MRKWIFVAVIGLAWSGSAVADDRDVDNDQDQDYVSPYQYVPSITERRRREQEDFDRSVEQANQMQAAFDRRKSLKIQEEMLEIEKKRLELQLERARR